MRWWSMQTAPAGHLRFLELVLGFLAAPHRQRTGRRAANVRDSRRESCAGILGAAGERNRSGVARNYHRGRNERHDFLLTPG